MVGGLLVSDRRSPTAKNDRFIDSHHLYRLCRVDVHAQSSGSFGSADDGNFDCRMRRHFFFGYFNEDYFGRRN
jgi:hypothetical protein